MTKAGLKVPEGIVLSTRFFTPWLTEMKSLDIWQELLEETAKKTCDGLKERATNLRFTKEQDRALQEALKHMDSVCYAVRSSSPEEDLEDTSFAGMYETILGVTKEELPHYVAKAFSSMYDYRVMEYKRRNHLNLENTRIAIIIQRQIPSEVSGVGFSINPANNCYDEAMINASFGLGETIVSGQVTPDTYVVEKVRQEILEKKINKKHMGLWLNKEGGTTERLNQDPMRVALTDKQIIELTKLIIDCEKYYKIPIDMEWAFDGNDLYLLQARPITTYIPLFPELITKPGEQKNLYIDVMGLTQGFTESMSVLGMEIWTKMIRVAKGDLYPVGIDGGIIPIHGRQYIQASNMSKVFGVKKARRMFGSYDGPTRMVFNSIDLKHEYMPAKKPDKMKGIMGKLLRYSLRLGAPVLKAILVDHKALLKEYKVASIEARKRIRDGNQEHMNFEDAIDDVISNFAKMMGTFGIVLAGILAMSKLKKMFKGEEAENLVISLGMDLDGNPTSDMGHKLYELACYEEIQKTQSSREFIRRIKNREYSRAFFEEYENYMSTYGCRGFKEIDIASPRAYENLDGFFQQLKAINTESNQLLHVKKRRKEAYDQLLAMAKKKGIQKKFLKYATMYQEIFGYREDPKYIDVYGVAKLRKIALSIGEGLVRDGRLQSREQIFDLHVSEITSALQDTSYNLIKAREKNLAPYKLVEHVKEWSNIIDSRGKIFRPVRKSEEGDMVGDPIAPGIVRGRAKVLHSPYEKPLEPGEILVTKATEPAWTPIFVNAAGVVLEVGGPLQHGAIIAREYGIPCVSGIYGVQDLIKDGDLLEVDGTSGIVKIIETS